MNNLNILNPNFITYNDEYLTIDVLGGVDLKQVERLICTLRIKHKEYPIYRTTLDLYNDTQNDKLLRTICDKWDLKLLEVSKSIQSLILQLEEYRLQNLKFVSKNQNIAFEISEIDKKNALKTLKSKNLIKLLTQKLNFTGIIGENDNALILFMALASHKYQNPFSVICLAKSGIGKSYILQKLSECMPTNSFSFHTQISENALYYFNSSDIQNKALLIEDLEWTTKMLTPLSTLQSQGKLVKTRTTKDKDGMFHSSTFEVVGNLCLVACAYSDKNYDSMALPFLTIHLNHSNQQDLDIMEYQKKCKAGLIKEEEIKKTQYHLKCMMSVLENVKIINPFAPFIHLPEDVSYPRKSLLLLLNFIEISTFFHQYQRESNVDTNTGEIYITTTYDDVKLGFQLLKNSLFRRADELSTTTRGFYHWLQNHLKEVKSNQFKNIDIRKAKKIHPRTLNHYLKELKLFDYIQVIGGNKYRGGFIYKLTNIDENLDLNNRIDKHLDEILDTISKKSISTDSVVSEQVGQNPLSKSQTQS